VKRYARITFVIWLSFICSDRFTLRSMIVINIGDTKNQIPRFWTEMVLMRRHSGSHRSLFLEGHARHSYNQRSMWGSHALDCLGLSRVDGGD
jgi:hypothetical protein